MKGVLTGALTSASVVISLTAFAPLAYATNVTSVEISLDIPKAGEELSFHMASGGGFIVHFTK
jgi:hypothetical protein